MSDDVGFALWIVCFASIAAGGVALWLLPGRGRSIGEGLLSLSLWSAAAVLVAATTDGPTECLAVHSSLYYVVAAIWALLSGLPATEGVRLARGDETRFPLPAAFVISILALFWGLAAVAASSGRC
jgi:hypothetical protein